ncbi:ERF family ssDNA binding protein [Mycobacterium phage BaboJay]|nr:ERF family ssDNA binding protein [Mycobacterium phage BaboJay]
MPDEAQTGPLADDPAPHTPTVFEAWSRVMSDVQAISKDSRNEQQHFNFRGIDAVMNVVGPALRAHGVTVIPRAVEEYSERYETQPRGNRPGTPMINRLVRVEFTVFGPRGDWFAGTTYGEAADSGDKAMSKAHSVAYRTFLLQALTIPTDEPDPDEDAHERAPRQERRREPKDEPPPLSDENAEGRAELREFCEENNLDAKVVAGKFATDNPGQSIRTADNETIRAYIATMKAGLVKADV